MAQSAEIPGAVVNDRVVDEFVELTFRLSRLARHQLQAHLALYQLTSPQYAALRCIERSQNRITVSALAQAAHQVTPTMTGILNRLEESRLVIRQRSSTDRRHQLVSLTGLGMALLEQISRDIRERMGALLLELRPEERVILISTIHNLANKFTIAVSPDSREDTGFEE